MWIPMWIIIVLVLLSDDLRGCVVMLALGAVALWILKWLGIFIFGGLYLLFH